MQINSINFNNKISAAKIPAIKNTAKDKEKLIKPLDTDSISFLGKKEDKISFIHPKMHSFLLKMGQKRAEKLEFQAKKIKEDAAEALGFSSIGQSFKNSGQIIAEGVETENNIKTTKQKYVYESGVLSEAIIDMTEDLNSGTTTAKQIFKFKDGKLSSVYEKITILSDGTRDFYRKYNTGADGKLHCIYNRIL